MKANTPADIHPSAARVALDIWRQAMAAADAARKQADRERRAARQRHPSAKAKAKRSHG